MKYIISYSNPQQHYIDIECIAESSGVEKMLFQLPSWRPGRYELANFAKNIQQWKASDGKGDALPFRKISKDCWEVETQKAKTVHIRYNYFASEINAGSSYLDENQIYVNPINCCLYVPELRSEICTLELKIPENYKVASSMKKTGKHTFEVKDYDELADSPFIASNSLQHTMFVLDGVEINVWFQGECKPNWGKLVNDFFIFINEHFVLFRECPTDEYHFILQALPYKAYHGVEHLKSTIITLGPSYKLMGELFNDLLGVSCHEFFHIWNIKSIRPAEMMPYDYTKENYSRLGYVYEGLTSYYGNYLLFRSGVFSQFEYFKTIFDCLQKHFDNFGRFNLSVAASSYDTWLDGYVPGAPGRKTSIYDEGELCAFITDILIRKNTENERSLDDVMRSLYYDFAKYGKGYTEGDYRTIVAKTAGTTLDTFFDECIYGTSSYEPWLKECLEYIGFTLKNAPSKKHHEAYHGFKITDTGGQMKVSAVWPGSNAEKEGLAMNDEITHINNFPIKNNFAEWVRYFGKEKITLFVISNGIAKTISLKATGEVFYKTWYVEKIKASEKQKQNYYAWCKKKF